MEMLISNLENLAGGAQGVGDDCVMSFQDYNFIDLTRKLSSFILTAVRLSIIRLTFGF